MHDVLFVVNPNAASGRAARIWSSLCERVRSLRTAAVVQCAEPAHAAQALLAAMTPGTRRVIVVGGDGTMHTTLNLLLARAPDRMHCLGLVPAGTGSDLAGGLGLESRPELALAEALEAEPAPLDALRLQAGGETRYYANEVSLGITSMVAARVNALTRRNTATFLTAALRELATYRPRRIRIRLDGNLWREGCFYMVVVANGSRFAKGMRIAPMADPRDGLADVVVVEAAPKAQLLTWLPTIYFGRHIAAPFVHHARAQTVELEADQADAQPPLFEGDGEVALSAPGGIALLPGAVMFSGGARR